MLDFGRLLLEFDRQLFRMFYTGLRFEPPGRDRAMDHFFHVANTFGEAFILIPVTVGVWLASVNKRQFAARVVVFGLGITIAVIGLNTWKRAADRSRPARAFSQPASSPLPEWHYYPPPGGWESAHPEPWLNEATNVPVRLDDPKSALLTNGAFPSGHTQFAYSLATALAIWFPLLRSWVFLWALFAGLSRIYAGHHFPGDVVMGALLGWFAMWLGFAMVRRFVNLWQPASRPRWVQWLATGLGRNEPREVRQHRWVNRCAVLGAGAVYVASMLVVVWVEVRNGSLPDLFWLPGVLAMLAWLIIRTDLAPLIRAIHTVFAGPPPPTTFPLARRQPPPLPWLPDPTGLREPTRIVVPRESRRSG